MLWWEKQGWKGAQQRERKEGNIPRDEERGIGVQTL